MSARQSKRTGTGTGFGVDSGGPAGMRARSAETRYTRPAAPGATLALRQRARAAGLVVIDLRAVTDLETARLCAAEADRQMDSLRLDMALRQTEEDS